MKEFIRNSYANVKIQNPLISLPKNKGKKRNPSNTNTDIRVFFFLFRVDEKSQFFSFYSLVVQKCR